MKHRSPTWARGPLGEQRLLEAASEMVRRYGNWSVFCTLTFASEHVHDRLARSMTKSFLTLLAKAIKAHMPFALAIEPQQRGVPHIHLLLQASPDDTAFILRRARGTWKKCGTVAGRIDVQAYDPKRNAIEYLLRHDDWDLNVACPRFAECRRLTGTKVCKEAPGPWT